MSHRTAISALAITLALPLLSLAGTKKDRTAKSDGIAWNAAANYATGTLTDNFWRVPGNGFTGVQPPYHFTNGVKGIQDFDNNYWPQAHGMDVFIDAYLRANKNGDKKNAAFYLECIDNGYKEAVGTGDLRKKVGILWPNFGMPKYADLSPCFGNQFVDDMEWHALTLIRLYEATGEPLYLREAQKLYAQIWKAWDLPEARDIVGNGGFIWCYGRDKLSKAGCSNFPGCLVAIRLHDVKMNTPAKRYKKDSHPDYVDFDYLANAKTVYEWVSSVLFNRETGQCYGGANAAEGVHKAFSLTYDQGTFLGAARLLHKYTGEKQYGDDAVKAALFTITNPGITKGGILRDEGAGGDNALFKGIFIRYAVQLVNDPKIDLAARKQLYKFINHQAETLWNKGLGRDAQGNPAGLFTPDWSFSTEQVKSRGKDYENPKMGWQVSGATLIEAMNVMKEPRK